MNHKLHWSQPQLNIQNINKTDNIITFRKKKITLRAIDTEQEAIQENHLLPLTNTCLSKVSVNQYDDSPNFTFRK